MLLPIETLSRMFGRTATPSSTRREPSKRNARLGLCVEPLEDRVLLAGELDTSFSGDGIATTDFGLSPDAAFDVAVQSDGKIVATGRARAVNGGVAHYNFGIARYNTDGTLDSSFGSGGKSSLDIGVQKKDDVIWAIGIQPDGKIVAAGDAFVKIGPKKNDPVQSHFALARFNSNGTLDTTFDGDGKVQTVIGSLSSAFDVVLQPDGRIVVAGWSGTSTRQFTVARYNTNGSLDTSLDGDGIVIVTAFDGFGRGVALQTDDKIVVVGRTFASPSDVKVVRLNPDGSLDTTFGSGGIVTTDGPAGLEDTARRVAIQSDGKIVIVGITWNSAPVANPADIWVVRYNSDGTLDSSFDSDGIVVTPNTTVPEAGDEGSDLVIQPDGKLVVAGVFGNVAPVLIRYNTDGSLDSTFDGDGIVSTVGGAGLAVKLQTDGKIVAAGGNGSDFVVTRHLGDGVIASSLAVRQDDELSVLPPAPPAATFVHDYLLDHDDLLRSQLTRSLLIDLLRSRRRR